LYFPHPLHADDDGLLAIGGDLSIDRLLLAYRFGIFPWYNEPPILWWFTHPRCVIYPNKVKISKSMRSYFNQNKFQVTYDRSFKNVMISCAHAKRINQNTTWITDDMIDAYCELHEAGYAHSVEVWQGDRLVGGLYGLTLGKIFYGESMFSNTSNASKFGFISLSRVLLDKGYELVDCQQKTDHMMSLGAQMMSKEEFYSLLKQNLLHSDQLGKWTNLS